MCEAGELFPCGLGSYFRGVALAWGAIPEELGSYFRGVERVRGVISEELGWLGELFPRGDAVFEWAQPTPFELFRC